MKTCARSSVLDCDPVLGWAWSRMQAERTDRSYRIEYGEQGSSMYFWDTEQQCLVLRWMGAPAERVGARRVQP